MSTFRTQRCPSSFPSTNPEDTGSWLYAPVSSPYKTNSNPSNADLSLNLNSYCIAIVFIKALKLLGLVTTDTLFPYSL